MIKRSVYHPKILIATLVRERNAERGYGSFQRKIPWICDNGQPYVGSYWHTPPLPLENNVKRHVYVNL